MILQKKGKDPSAVTNNLEAQLDAKIAHLYGLTKEEYTQILHETGVAEGFRGAALNFYKSGKSKP